MDRSKKDESLLDPLPRPLKGRRDCLNLSLIRLLEARVERHTGGEKRRYTNHTHLHARSRMVADVQEYGPQNEAEDHGREDTCPAVLKIAVMVPLHTQDDLPELPDIRRRGAHKRWLLAQLALAAAERLNLAHLAEGKVAARGGIGDSGAHKLLGKSIGDAPGKSISRDLGQLRGG